MLLGTIPGSVGETSFFAIMLGAVILISTELHLGGLFFQHL